MKKHLHKKRIYTKIYTKKEIHKKETYMGRRLT